MWNAGMALLLAYPWLHPLARGPSVMVEPYLVGQWCALIVFAAVAARGHTLIHRSALLVAASCALLFSLRFVFQPVQVPSQAAGVFAGMFCVLGATIVGHSLKREDLRVIAAGWLLAGLISLCIVGVQALGWEPFFGGAVAASPGHQALGNLRQRNLLSSLFAISIPAALWLSVQRQIRWRAWIFYVCVALMLVGIALTASRTGLVEVLVLGALWVVWARPGRPTFIRVGVFVAIYLAAAGALVALSAAEGSPKLLLRILGDAPDCHGRALLWQTAASLVQAHPLAGIGWGEFPLAIYSAKSTPHFCALVDNAHNLPLHLAVEFGLPVALMFVAACLLYVWRRSPWQATGAEQRLGWAVVALIAVHSLLEFPLWYSPFQLALGLGVGLTLRGEPAFRLSRSTCAAALMGVGILLGLATWEYARVSQLYLAPEVRWRSLRQDALQKVEPGLFFRGQIEFAKLMQLPVTPQTAAAVFQMSTRVMHVSPEPGVIERRLQSAYFLGKKFEVREELSRYAGTYPAEAARWAASHPDFVLSE